MSEDTRGGRSARPLSPRCGPARSPPRHAFLGLAVALGAGLALVEPAVGGEKRFINIGTGGSSGVYFQVGQSLCRLLHKEAAVARREGRGNGIRCTAPATGGSIYNVGQIAEGEIDFGIAQSDVQHDAYFGKGKFEGRRVRKLRAVFGVHTEPFHVIVRSDSGINSWGDLHGKTVNIGNPASGQRASMDALMAAYGTTRSDFRAATELTSAEQSKALCDGKIDAFGFTVGVPNAGVAVATDGCGARIISLDDEPVRKLAAEHPYYLMATIPRGTYKTTDTDIVTFAVKATLVTSADVPDDIVYAVVRAVFENLDDFRRLHPAFAELNPESMINEALTVPLHPGAFAYYEEKGWK